jgi:transcriptional regulator with XRE-family HTH domain
MNQPRNYEKFRRQLGQRIRKRRIERRMTLMELASAIDTSERYIVSLEEGIRGTRLATLLLIAEALHVKPATLFEDKK